MMFGQRYSPPVLASTILAVWMVAALQAQEAKDPGAAKAAMQAKVAELKQSLAANQKALQQYTWIETTEFSMKGEVKKTERKECRYGTDGKVIKTDRAPARPQAPQSSQGGGRRGGRSGGAVKRRWSQTRSRACKNIWRRSHPSSKSTCRPTPRRSRPPRRAARLPWITKALRA